MSEQIQNISDEILEYKNKFFFKIFSDFLREKKAPFPENVTHYLDLLFPYELIKPNEITLNSIRKENNEYSFEDGPVRLNEIRIYKPNSYSCTAVINYADKNNSTVEKEFKLSNVTDFAAQNGGIILFNDEGL